MLSLSRLKEVVKSHNISIAIMTVPADSAVEVSEQLVEAGIKGVLNFTTVPLNLAPKFTWMNMI